MDLCLVLDHACNLRCRYCYTGQKYAAAMSESVLREAVELALAAGDDWLSITLFGGEPLVRPGILWRVEGIVDDVCGQSRRPRQLRWLIDTNATLLGADSLAWLERHPEATVIASLDGRARVHDRNRVDAVGGGSHAAVLGGLEALAKRHLDFQLVAVVGPDTCDELPDSVAYLLGLGASRIALQTNLRAGWHEADLASYRHAVRGVGEVWGRAFRAGAAPVLEPLHSKVLSHLTCTRPLPARCRLASRSVAVAPSGRLYPCAEMVGEDRNPALAIGHVSVGLDARRVAALRARSAREHAACVACPIRARCSSGCACRQLASAGGVGQVSALLCATEAAWVETADEVASGLVGEACPSFLELYYG